MEEGGVFAGELKWLSLWDTFRLRLSGAKPEHLKIVKRRLIADEDFEK